MKKPELIVFAGPNGSGKSTISTPEWILEPYINADNIKKATYCSDLDAAELADKLRSEALRDRSSFSFETVLSTSRKLDLMRQVKEAGYFIRGYFILTCDPLLNVARVQARASSGGHGVPEEKIISRYHKALANIPTFIDLCDICHIYDNTVEPFRIFRKHKETETIFPSEFWSEEAILQLTGRQGNI